MICSAVVALTGLAWIGSGLFSDREALKKYEGLVGRTRKEVLRLLGAPGKRFKAGDPEYPIPGYLKPPARSFTSCDVYWQRYSVVYVYYGPSERVTGFFASGG